MADDITEDLLKAVNQLYRFLLSERDLANMLQGICDRLVGEQLFRSALIVLQDQAMGGMITAETGLADRLPQVMAELRAGVLPRCGQEILELERPPVMPCDPELCGGCSMLAGEADSQKICAGLCTAISCVPSLSGFLVVSGQEGCQGGKPGPAVLQLFTEIGSAISLALGRLSALEEAQRREEELCLVEERYELALFASQAGLWDWNIQTGTMYTSPNQKEYLDYRKGDSSPGAIQRFIHPDDKERVLAVLNDHLAGKNQEYQIEYRVKGEHDQWVWYLDRGKVVERDQNGMPVRMTGTHQNISLQKQREQTLAAIQQQLHQAVDHERNFLQTVIDSAGDPVMVIDLNYTILLINRTAAGLIEGDHSAGLIQEKKCYQLFCKETQPCNDGRYPCPVREVQRESQQQQLIHNPYHGNRINNTFEIDVSPLYDGDGRLYGIIEIGRDITDRLRIEKELRDSQSKLYRLAHHDTLTGLPNRLLVKDRLNQAIIKGDRIKKSVAIMYLDLDRFKQVNDTLGHDVGDALLVEVATRLQQQCRQSDTVGRLGGDEFVFILDEIASKEDVAMVAHKIIASMEQPVVVQGHQIMISTSVGIALYPDDSADVEGVVKCADMALYEAKELGRNCYRFYNRQTAPLGQRRYLQAVDSELGLQLDRLAVRYQAIYKLEDDSLAGLDARVSWQHPSQGEVAVLQRYQGEQGEDNSVEIGLRVLGEVCADLEFWQSRGAWHLPVLLRVGEEQLRSQEFVQGVAAELQRRNLPGNRIELVLPPAILAGEDRRAEQHLAFLEPLGLRFAVADLGGEALSLARLQGLPLQRLILERGLPDQGRKGGDGSCLIDLLVGLGRQLRLELVGQGVEQGSQLDFLRQHGCDQVMGDLLAPPRDRAGVLELLASQDGYGVGSAKGS
ncbi:sensor domain-containing protein [Desulfogranum mediterraneum]|uniref:sensor domain-containing protein n=1 Tax=Desulfogranum mediterraneum TaxID=160661 RepID=UPI00041E32C5|nr:diguanylate cyclase [Desulfogranum mediterraneum]